MLRRTGEAAVPGLAQPGPLGAAAVPLGSGFHYRKPPVPHLQGHRLRQPPGPEQTGILERAKRVPPRLLEVLRAARRDCSRRQTVSLAIRRELSSLLEQRALPL